MFSFARGFHNKMTASSKSIIHFKAIGKVQGVFFRAETKDRASSLGLAGWCHNHSDASVEGVAYGPTEKVNEFRKYLSQGPPKANVERVEYLREVDAPEKSVVEELLGRDHKGDFEIRRHH